jgi:hypothetical protein
MRQRKIELLRQEQERKELEQCSFFPDTNVSRMEGEEQPRDLVQFLQDQQKHL